MCITHDDSTPHNENEHRVVPKLEDTHTSDLAQVTAFSSKANNPTFWLLSSNSFPNSVLNENGMHSKISKQE